MSRSAFAFLIALLAIGTWYATGIVAGLRLRQSLEARCALGCLHQAVPADLCWSTCVHTALLGTPTRSPNPPPWVAERSHTP